MKEQPRVDAHFWERIDAVIDSAPGPQGLRTHGLGALAAWRLRERGLPVPEELAVAARGAGFAAVTAAPLLERVRAAVDGPIVVLKGPEVAALYPIPALRSFGDLDLLVEDVTAADAALRAAGFALAGSPERVIPGHHHDTPLRWPGSAIALELHRDPGFLPWMSPPSNAEFFARAVPTVEGVIGVGALPRAEHALLLAAHSWRHEPLRSWLDLVDIALVREGLDPVELQRMADIWGMGRVWRATSQAIDALLFGQGRAPRLAERLWARHLSEWRERTLLEWYAVWWTRGLAAHGTRRQIQAVAADVRFSLTAHPWQTRGGKARRIGSALTRAFAPASRHRHG